MFDEGCTGTTGVLLGFRVFAALKHLDAGAPGRTSSLIRLVPQAGARCHKPTSCPTSRRYLVLLSLNPVCESHELPCLAESRAPGLTSKLVLLIA
jgi:hypothetical protein